MENLTTSYMGLELKSPLVVASSRITSKTENCQKAEEFGAGAIVLRSLFEEQIIADMIKNFPEEAGKYHPEAIEYYEFALKLKPDAAFYYNNIGFSYYNLGQIAKAIEYYNKALQLDPNYKVAKNNLKIAHKN